MPGTARPHVTLLARSEGGVGWAYTGFISYAPNSHAFSEQHSKTWENVETGDLPSNAAHLGQNGWNIGIELREGAQHRYRFPATLPSHTLDTPTAGTYARAHIHPVSIR